jgi:hypothetical protein
MPEYVAKCSCGKTFRYSSLISNRNEPTECECGLMANRDVGAEFKSIGDRHKWVTDNERWSLSMGVPVAQLDEFRKRFPNSTYDDRGRLLIKNRKDKLRQMKERDFCELSDRR